MNKRKLEYFKQKLLREKQEAINTINEDIHSFFQDYYKELSLYDNHPADIGSETFEMEMQMNLEDKEQKHLLKVEKALEKIENGTYGICEKCGKEIEFDRLDIIPDTEFCMKCSKDSISLDEKLKTRPVEEEYLKTPYKIFNGSFRLSGLDGEDTWQEVARYNKTDYKKMALDWYDNNMYDGSISGKVEDVEDISLEYYKKQINDDINKKDK
ncbi:TraR/DksA C4-type zinc finger protein [Caminicella sporogenes]|uniref:TraR/DksA C4-type zinc finger protein n=1 Tax=Caminicella sporogenes TaxID=166485 RepID=UPI002540E714|nr:TraR/DksA C4-type zinc finger protein [Caminicella sporogenes]WIF94571.1 TraR/DksA C4-type zinc finger protein [Caminicella sporogenes]